MSFFRSRKKPSLKPFKIVEDYVPHPSSSPKEQKTAPNTSFFSIDEPADTKAQTGNLFSNAPMVHHLNQFLDYKSHVNFASSSASLKQKLVTSSQQLKQGSKECRNRIKLSISRIQKNLKILSFTKAEKESIQQMLAIAKLVLQENYLGIIKLLNLTNNYEEELLQKISTFEAVLETSNNSIFSQMRLLGNDIYTWLSSTYTGTQKEEKQLVEERMRARGKHFYATLVQPATLKIGALVGLLDFSLRLLICGKEDNKPNYIEGLLICSIVLRSLQLAAYRYGLNLKDNQTEFFREVSQLDACLFAYPKLRKLPSIDSAKQPTITKP